MLTVSIQVSMLPTCLPQRKIAAEATNITFVNVTTVTGGSLSSHSLPEYYLDRDKPPHSAPEAEAGPTFPNVGPSCRMAWEF